MAAQNNNAAKAVRANLPEQEGTGRARDHAAAVVSVSPRLVEHASQVIAQGAEELAQAVRAGFVKPESGLTALNRAWKKASAEERAAFMRTAGLVAV